MRLLTSVARSSAILVRTHRSYATAAPQGGGNRRGRRLGPALSLDHFLLRARVLALYRAVLRGTAHLKDARARDEMRRLARDEFDRRRGVTDPDQIRYLLSTGKAEWENAYRSVRHVVGM